MRGNEDFIVKAQNLFENLGGDVENGPLDGSSPRWREHRAITFRQGNDKGSVFFCLPVKRFHKAINLYLYGQLVLAKGVWQEKRDEEGSFLGTECLNEGELEREAETLALSFYENEVGLDYRSIPEYVHTVGLTEYEFHHPFPS